MIRPCPILRTLTYVFSSVLFWFVVTIFAFALLLALHFSLWAPTKLQWWMDFYAVAISFMVGAVVSFLFYFLVVFLPDRRRRNIIKSNLTKVYEDIKRNILFEVINASHNGGRQDLVADSETVERLMTIQGFREAFEGGRKSNEGFYAFRNYISDDVPEYRAIVLNFRILQKQIDYVLHNYPIKRGEIFDFFKRLEMFLMRLESIGPGYDEEKVLSEFLWEIFGGWSFIEGYRDYDIIDKMIRDI